MKALIVKMLNLELQAAEFYQCSSDYFKDNKTVSNFLCGLADDEEFHYRILRKAAEHVDVYDALDSYFTIDDRIYSDIQNAIDKSIQQMSLGEFSLNDLFNIISMIEFSEWNGFFFYIVNSIKDKNIEFKNAAIKLQHHLRSIKNFFVILSNSRDYVKLMKDLPAVWSERILIVDDDESVSSMLETLLESDGIVETACNGKAALEKLKSKYYSVIISDITMPHMDGISFYKEAARSYRNINRRFIFFSANPTDEQIEFIKDNSLKFMAKPTSIRTIRENVYQVINRNVETLNLN